MSKNDYQHFTISIAGIVIRINTMYTRTYWMCKNYISELNPDFEISIAEIDLIEEQILTLGTCERRMGGYLEPAAVHRKIAERLTDYNAVLMHGAAISVNNKGYIFSGESGVGKTTHIKKWLNCNPNTFVVNGDKPIIRYLHDSFFVCGTPWSGKEHIDTNTMVELDSIAFMKRNADNIIDRISFSHAFPRLLDQTFIHNDESNANRTLELLIKMKDKVRFFDFLSNNMREDSYQVAYKGLIGGIGNNENSALEFH